ncbi:hypothetical protein BU23DRAFT_312633 [Bimuria novae-zelandiae CBS 107.79]|uniref:BZIP domain-containing protein n=1 Tax=Bimuria novae-zelandiae CBS 107.79 TaxID=1447943 RepID=A0A6A5USC6_9PLEO|nr:hypothetical protein BU23DRAFT_312633 [Bimuria novae-zelandiae CBS 107.79]
MRFSGTSLRPMTRSFMPGTVSVMAMYVPKDKYMCLGLEGACDTDTWKWLHPIVDNAELDASNVTESLSSASDNNASLDTNVVPARRGRGRPRVETPRDESAVEKRRAQVREAQRAYQKRKDSATASERRRCDDVLQVLSDLSMDVEALLQAAADAGVTKEEGEIPDHVRRLWSTYNTVINNPCLGPELRLLQVKNERRQSAHLNATRPSTEVNSNMQLVSHVSDPACMVDLDIGQRTDSTLITNFATAHLNFPQSGNRNIYEVCRERQADFHPTRNPV